MTLTEWANQLFQVLEVGNKTLNNYRGAFNRYISQFIGDINLDEITKVDISKVLAPLPQPTRYASLMVLKTIYREGLSHGVCKNNPTSGIKIPKWHPKKRNFLTWEELCAIDFGSQTQRIQFLALHGLRWGEAAALEAEDCADGLVSITKSKYGQTKTKAGVRVVPQLAPYVNFPLHQNGVAKALKPYGVTVHSLRRTYAYMLKHANVHVTTAAKLMGHANPLVTLTIYTQVLDLEVDSAGDSLRHFMTHVA